MRFWSSNPLIFRGWKSVGTALLPGCGTKAVPDGGNCPGVKNDTFGAATFSKSSVADMAISFNVAVLFYYGFFGEWESFPGICERGGRLEDEEGDAAIPRTHPGPYIPRTVCFPTHNPRRARGILTQFAAHRTRMVDANPRTSGRPWKFLPFAR